MDNASKAYIMVYKTIIHELKSMKTDFKIFIQ